MPRPRKPKLPGAPEGALSVPKGALDENFTPEWVLNPALLPKKPPTSERPARRTVYRDDP